MTACFPLCTNGLKISRPILIVAAILQTLSLPARKHYPQRESLLLSFFPQFPQAFKAHLIPLSAEKLFRLHPQNPLLSIVTGKNSPKKATHSTTMMLTPKLSSNYTLCQTPEKTVQLPSESCAFQFKCG